MKYNKRLQGTQDTGMSWFGVTARFTKTETETCSGVGC